jgi:mycothiol synthase
VALVVTRVGEPNQRTQIEELIARAAEHDGRAPLSEQKLHDFHHGRGHESDGLVAEVDRTVVGFAQLSGSASMWGLEIVIHPDWRNDDGIRQELVRAAVDLAQEKASRPVHYWIAAPTASDDALAHRLGFVTDRDLWQMMVHLPLAEQPSLPPSASLRPFVVGQDESAWLTVNNRAFADHPEQGGWTIETLRAREDEPWFNPDGFFLLEEHGRLLGSCWTKIHRSSDPPTGEIYVISIDPSAHGQGLGRALTVVGLNWLSDQGLAVGMLYTTASNVAAVALYRALGFEVSHIDRTYVLTPTKRPTV